MDVAVLHSVAAYRLAAHKKYPRLDCAADFQVLSADLWLRRLKQDMPRVTYMSGTRHTTCRDRR